MIREHKQALLAIQDVCDWLHDESEVEQTRQELANQIGELFLLADRLNTLDYVLFIECFELLNLDDKLFDRIRNKVKTAFERITDYLDSTDIKTKRSQINVLLLINYLRAIVHKPLLTDAKSLSVIAQAEYSNEPLTEGDFELLQQMKAIRADFQRLLLRYIQRDDADLILESLSEWLDDLIDLDKYMPSVKTWMVVKSLFDTIEITDEFLYDSLLSILKNIDQQLRLGCEESTLHLFLHKNNNDLIKQVLLLIWHLDEHQQLDLNADERKLSVESIYAGVGLLKAQDQDKVIEQCASILDSRAFRHLHGIQQLTNYLVLLELPQLLHRSLIQWSAYTQHAKLPIAKEENLIADIHRALAAMSMAKTSIELPNEFIDLCFGQLADIMHALNAVIIDPKDMAAIESLQQAFSSLAKSAEQQQALSIKQLCQTIGRLLTQAQLAQCIDEPIINTIEATCDLMPVIIHAYNEQQSPDDSILQLIDGAQRLLLDVPNVVREQESDIFHKASNPITALIDELLAKNIQEKQSQLKGDSPQNSSLQIDLNFMANDRTVNLAITDDQAAINKIDIMPSILKAGACLDNFQLHDGKTQIAISLPLVRRNYRVLQSEGLSYALGERFIERVVTIIASQVNWQQQTVTIGEEEYAFITLAAALNKDEQTYHEQETLHAVFVQTEHPYVLLAQEQLGCFDLVEKPLAKSLQQQAILLASAVLPENGQIAFVIDPEVVVLAQDEISSI